MRILVAGSRSIRDYQLVARILRQVVPKTTGTFIVGGAAGVDAMAETWGNTHGHQIERYRPDWRRWGKSAGFVRNARMLREGKPDMAVLIWDGKSPGTAHMKTLLVEAGIHTFVFCKGKAEVLRGKTSGGS